MFCHGYLSSQIQRDDREGMASVETPHLLSRLRCDSGYVERTGYIVVLLQGPKLCPDIRLFVCIHRGLSP